MTQGNSTIDLEHYDVQERFVRAIGPGGHHLSRGATAVELRVNLKTLPVSPAVKHRLLVLAGRHVTSGDVLIVTSRAHRSQEKNREAARARLAALLTRAESAPPPRQATATGPVEKEQRLAEKKRRGARKRARHPRPDGDE